MSHATQLIQARVIVAPSNTEDNPVVSEWFQTLRGALAHLLMQFPTGANGRVHARLETRTTILAPDEGTFSLGGGPPVEFPGLHRIITDPDPAVRLVAWVDAGATNNTTIDAYMTFTAVV